jgi:hypothetical protein
MLSQEVNTSTLVNVKMKTTVELEGTINVLGIEVKK